MTRQHVLRELGKKRKSVKSEFSLCVQSVRSFCLSAVFTPKKKRKGGGGEETNQRGNQLFVTPKAARATATQFNKDRPAIGKLTLSVRLGEPDMTRLAETPTTSGAVATHDAR